jgi:hypothetical protein
MTYFIDGVRYVRWNEKTHAEMNPEKFAVNIRFSKQKNKYVVVKSPTKTTIKAVKSLDVGEHTSVVTDVLSQRKSMLSLKHDIQPILPWVSFCITETNPTILCHLIDGSRVTADGKDLEIPRTWCWKQLFPHKFYHLELVEVNDEICTSMEEWIRNTPTLCAEFGHDPYSLFEHDKGPGVCDVEIVDDTIYVKVIYLF